MDNLQIYLFIAALLILASVAVKRRLNRVVQPLRLRMAREGRSLLERPSLPARHRQCVEHLLDTAFGMRTAIILGFVAVPILSVIFVVRQRWFQSLRVEKESMSPEDVAAFDRVWKLHDRITLANHFILYPFLELEILLCMQTAVIVRALLRMDFATAGDKESILSVVENLHLPSFSKAA